MTKFCTGCGSQLAAGACFCEQCGKAIASAEKIQANRPLSHPSSPEAATGNARPHSLKKAGLISGCIAIALGIAGGSAYWLLRDPEPPGTAEVSAQIKANRPLVEQLTCLDNFDYSANPVQINPYDNNTRAWLTALVEGGLYGLPEEVTTGDGYFTQQHLRYTQLEAAKQFIHGKRLCFASGLVIEDVRYEPENPQENPRRLTGQASYHYDNLAPWASLPALKNSVDRLQAQKLSLPVSYELREGKWEAVPPGSPVTTRDRSYPTKAAAPAEAQSAGGFFSWLDGLFGSDPGASVQGRWQVEGGLLPMAFEFHKDTAVIFGQTIPVTYSRSGDLVAVHARKNGQKGDSLDLQVLSANELLLISDDGNNLRLTRTN